MSTITTDPAAERGRIRSELDRRRMARVAEAILSEQATERQLTREAEAELRADGKITRAGAEMRRAMREQAIARRRDAWRVALSYPMNGDELVAACQHATLAAKVPAGAFEDVSQALAAHVIRRHGPTPERVKLGAGWLRERAQWIYLNQRAADERATGARAAADQLADWRAHDHRAAMAMAASAGGDAVWALAANRPALLPALSRPVSPYTIASGLGFAVRSRATRSITAALNERRQHRAPLTDAERSALSYVRRALRGRFPDPAALLLAIRPVAYAAEVLTDAAIRDERRRALVSSRGGCSASYWR